ncbi:hypothetical protein A3Q56_06891 [Intoshia linei]|uniref:MULE transposase domain-containing protein n=1 Tax=Intoshia linei TaxID=1819745 RepID=A0A177ATS0_9BILA|nr:hypothetical protein A3Q56_06891 [Intoshia linei]
MTVSDEIYIQAHATYKLICQGYPVLIAGTSDMNKRFHPVNLAVITEEKTEDYEFLFKSIKSGMLQLSIAKEFNILVADASYAVTNVTYDPNDHG